jgi:hypothetical protein
MVKTKTPLSVREGSTLVAPMNRSPPIGRE